MDTKILEHCSFIVLRDHTLTVEEQKILTHLYMPLIGPRSLNIYMTLGTFINQGDSESIKNGHLKLFQMLQVHKESEFIRVMKKYNVKRCYYAHLHSGSIKDAVEGEHFGIEFKLVSADGVNFKLVQI